MKKIEKLKKTNNSVSIEDKKLLENIFEPEVSSDSSGNPNNQKNLQNLNSILEPI